jgi:hypothetical protein
MRITVSKSSFKSSFKVLPSSKKKQARTHRHTHKHKKKKKETLEEKKDY